METYSKKLKMQNIILFFLLNVALVTTMHKTYAEIQHGTHQLMEKAIVIHNSIVKVTPPGITNSAGYFHIMNHSDEDIKLVAVESNISKRTEIHQHTMNNGLMKMPLKEIRQHSKY